VRREDLLHGAAGVGEFAGEHLVEADTERVDVALLVDPLALARLRRHVERRSHPRLGADTGQPEVEYLDETGAPLEHHVRRLDVAVHHVRLVRGSERLRDLECDAERLLHRQRAVALDQLMQRLAGHELHQDADLVLVVLDHVVHADDVGVLDLSDCPRLCDEAISHLVGASEVPGQDLESDVAPERLVVRAVDPGRAAVPGRLAHDAARDRAADVLAGVGWRL